MVRAVSVRDGKLTEIEVPELAVFKKVSRQWREVKSSTAVCLCGARRNLDFKRRGWYIINGIPVFKSKSDGHRLKSFFGVVWVLGPFE